MQQELQLSEVYQTQTFTEKDEYLGNIHSKLSSFSVTPYGVLISLN